MHAILAMEGNKWKIEKGKQAANVRKEKEKRAKEKGDLGQKREEKKRRRKAEQETGTTTQTKKKKVTCINCPRVLYGRGLKCVQCEGTVCPTCHKFRGRAVASQRLTFV